MIPVSVKTLLYSTYPQQDLLVQWLMHSDPPEVDLFQYPQLFHILRHHLSPKAFSMWLQHLMIPYHLKWTNNNCFIG